MNLGKFILQELVPAHVYDERRGQSIELLDREAVEGLIRLRSDVGKPFIINTWVYGGDRGWSGLRTTKSPHYRPYSQHTFGRAFDIVSPAFSPDWLQKFVQDNHDRYGITGLELQKE